MSIQAIGMKAYTEALNRFSAAESNLRGGAPAGGTHAFTKALDQSLLRDSVDKGENSGAQADFISQYSRTGSNTMADNSFTGTLNNSWNKINELQKSKDAAIEDFASGRTQNVHELMITMQKASLAMNLTSAVRGKVIEAYKELSRMQF